MSVLRRLVPRRVAVLSVHTSPLEQPGTGDAGGMNVYIVETARRLAERGVEVEIFTRATSGELPPTVDLAPGVLVRHLPAGPFEPMAKEDLPGLLCSFSTGLLRVEAQHEPGYFDLVHSHYWLSGQVGTLAQDRWRVPLVHSMHTMAKVKNQLLADGDTPEPSTRAVGESQVVAAADRLVANTSAEANQLDRPLQRRPGGSGGRTAGRRPCGIHSGQPRDRTTTAGYRERCPAAAVRGTHPAAEGT